MRLGKKSLLLVTSLWLVSVSGAIGSAPASRHRAAESIAAARPLSSESVPTVTTTYNWNAAWVVDTRSTASFDSEDRVISILTESTSDGGSTWDNEGLIEYVYSSADWPDTQTVYFWSTTFDTWDPLNRSAFQYDGSGNVLVETMEEHTTQTWQNFRRVSWTRDGLGMPIEQINEIWSSGSWNNSTRTVYNFNGDQLADAENYFWIGSWSLLDRSLYTYGPDGETEELQQSWNGMSWTGTQRYTTTYSSGLPSEYLYQVWNGSMWIDQSRQLYQAYDGQGRLLVEDTQFNFGAWQNTSRVEYEYGTPTSIGDDTPATLPSGVALFQNYPNPFNPSTDIAFSLPTRSRLTVTVLDILGRTVTELFQGEKPAGEHTVRWDGADRSGNRVASGVYFYRIVTDDGSLAKKMLLVK